MSSLAAAATYHTVSRGDTLYLIAQRYGVSIAALRNANNLRSDVLYPGQTLVVSSVGGGSGSSSGTQYVVKAGDSLWRLSTQFGVSIAAIRSANGLVSDALHVGQKLTIPGSHSGGGQSGSTTYTVKSGDSLYLIAQRFGITVNQIRQLNGLSSNTIYVGQTLKVSSTGASNPVPAPPTQQVVYVHSVKWGETLESIGRNYGVTAQAIASANMLTSYTVKSPMALIIPGPTKNHAGLTGLYLKPGMSVADFHRLARMTYAEAGAEPYSGQVAVAAVILNRIASPKFPNTMDGVLKQAWQFEPVSNGYYYNCVPSLSAYKAALDAVNGVDPSRGALFFFNPAKITNQWLLSKPFVYQVGSHAFAY